MKLLIYTPVFLPSIGGIESIVLSLADGLSRIITKGQDPEFEITLVSPTAAGPSQDEQFRFGVARSPSVAELWRLIRKSDLVHIASPALAPLILGLMARKPLVVEHHGFQTICPTGQLLLESTGEPCPGHFMAGRHQHCLRCRPQARWWSSLKLWLFTFARRFFCNRVAANIMPTEWLIQPLALANSIAIPHGIVMLNRGNPAPQSASHDPRIVFQGRLVTTKGADLLLRAAAILRDEKRKFELVIIGDGPERLALERLAQELELSSLTRFTGRLTGPDMDAEFANARLVVMPSVGGEVFGLVLVENMSRGIAMVASDLGPFVEVLGDTGLTFRVGDICDLARQVGRLVDDPELARDLGLRAQSRIRNIYARDRMVRAHAEVYRRVLSK